MSILIPCAIVAYCLVVLATCRVLRHLRRATTHTPRLRGRR